MKDDNKIDIASRLLKLREDNNVTQPEISDYLGIKVGVYQHYESGRARPPLETLYRIADFYGFNGVDELLNKKKKAPDFMKNYLKLNSDQRKIVDYILNKCC